MAAVGSMDGSVYTQTKTELWFTGPTLPPGFDKKETQRSVVHESMWSTTNGVNGKVFTSKSLEYLEKFWCLLAWTVFSFFCFPKLTTRNKVMKPVKWLLCWFGWFRLFGSELGLRCNLILTRIPTFNFQCSCATQASCSSKTRASAGWFKTLCHTIWLLFIVNLWHWQLLM